MNICIVIRNDDDEILNIISESSWRAFFRCNGKTDKEIDEMFEKLKVESDERKSGE